MANQNNYSNSPCPIICPTTYQSCNDKLENCLPYKIKLEEIKQSENELDARRAWEETKEKYDFTSAEDVPEEIKGRDKNRQLEKSLVLGEDK